MSELKTLGAFVQQRLTAAAEEILELFGRTIKDYEEEIGRQRKLLDAALKPEVVLHRADVQLLVVSRREVPPEPQGEGPSLDKVNPREPPHIKEEQEEDQPQGLEEADVTVTYTPVRVKCERDGEKPESSQLHQSEGMKTEADGEDCGGPEPDGNFHTDSHLQPDTDAENSLSSEHEVDGRCDWGETRESQSGVQSLRNNGDPECGIGKAQLGSSDCATSFGPQRYLQEHSGIQTGLKPFSCSLCGRTYSSKQTLRVHTRYHLEKKSFNCTVCQKAFLLKGDLVRHMRVHTGEKPFSCSVCGRRFARKEHQKKHMSTHIGEKAFYCSVCGIRFTWLTRMKTHKCAGETSGRK